MKPFTLARAGRALMLAWDLILVAALLQIWSGHEPFPGANAGASAAVIGVAVVWTWYWLRLRGRDWWQGGVVAGVGLLAIVLAVDPAIPPGTSIVIFACAILGAGLPPRYGVPAAVGAALLAFGEDLAKGNASVAASLVFNNVLVGLVVVAARVFIGSYYDLHAAREEIARLAVAEERLRFSRDLHDLLGHSLAVIVLKGEVASRQLPAGSPTRSELGEMVAVARLALDQVREAVAGYRLPSLDQELVNARAALVKGGIATAIENTAGNLPPTAESVLGWAVREGATNVIKHSHARSCRIEVRVEQGSARLEMENDGLDGHPVEAGNGLRGLDERARLFGGTAAYETAGGRFRLSVEVPVEAGAALQPA